jgi:hypothetical protein
MDKGRVPIPEPAGCPSPAAFSAFKGQPSRPLYIADPYFWIFCGYHAKYQEEICGKILSSLGNLPVSMGRILENARSRLPCYNIIPISININLGFGSIFSALKQFQNHYAPSAILRFLRLFIPLIFSAQIPLHAKLNSHQKRIYEKGAVFSPRNTKIRLISSACLFYLSP